MPTRNVLDVGNIDQMIVLYI